MLVELAPGGSDETLTRFLGVVVVVVVVNAGVATKTADVFASESEKGFTSLLSFNSGFVFW